MLKIHKSVKWLIVAAVATLLLVKTDVVEAEPIVQQCTGDFTRAQCRKEKDNAVKSCEAISQHVHHMLQRCEWYHSGTVEALKACEQRNSE